ncbi:MAG: EamA/RhaT family transporter [Alphaproteobacteria bacterium]|nr:EamA/RhaT family transporter [Alphaproteobacteria bacterium]
MSRQVAHGLLLLTSFVWGITFVFQTTGMETIGPFGFTTLKFLTGTITILPMAIWEYRRAPLQTIMLDSGSALQQVSLGITSIANTAFLTTLYVPLVPILGLLMFRRNMRKLRWVAVAIFVVGSWLMSGASPSDAVIGDVMVIIGAFFWAGHIMLVGWMAQRTHAPFQLAFLQMLITTILSYGVFSFTETMTLMDLSAVWPEILFAGIMSTGLGFTLQLIAQQHCSNAAAAILLSLEGVFAAISGWVLLGQSMLVSAMMGAGLIFVAVLIVELSPEFKEQSQ